MLFLVTAEGRQSVIHAEGEVAVKTEFLVKRLN
jgi:hypothetical protein